MEITGLSIRIPAGELDLSDQDKDHYAPIGYFMCQVAGLEYDMDEFAFNLAESDPIFAKSCSKDGHFPSQFKAKKEFLLQALERHPDLSRLEDSKGVLDLRVIRFEIEFALEVRNIMFHGVHLSADFTKADPVFCFQKHSKDRSKGADRRRSYRVETFQLERSRIETALADISYVSAIVRTAGRVLKGDDVWAEAEELRKGRAAAREMLQILKERDGELDETGKLIEALVGRDDD